MTENNIRVLTLNWISQDWKSDKSGYPGWIVSMDNKTRDPSVDGNWRLQALY